MEEDEKKESEKDVEDSEEEDSGEEKDKLQIEIDKSKIGNLAEKFGRPRQIDPTLQPVAEVIENAPVNLEASVKDVWTEDNKKEETPEYKIAYEDIAKSYDDSRSVKVFDDPNMVISRMENIDMNPVNLGRDWSPVKTTTISNEMINPELRELRSRQGNLESDYVVKTGDGIKEFKTHSPFAQQKREYEIK